MFEPRFSRSAMLGGLAIALCMLLPAEGQAQLEGFCWYCDTTTEVQGGGCYASNGEYEPGATWCETDLEEGPTGGCWQWNPGECEPCPHCGPVSWFLSMYVDRGISAAASKLLGTGGACLVSGFEEGVLASTSAPPSSPDPDVLVNSPFTDLGATPSTRVPT